MCVKIDECVHVYKHCIHTPTCWCTQVCGDKGDAPAANGSSVGWGGEGEGQ